MILDLLFAAVVLVALLAAPFVAVAIAFAVFVSVDKLNRTLRRNQATEATYS